MINISELKHSKEKTYLLIMQIVGGLFWLLFLFSTLGTILIPVLMIVLSLWILGLYFKAVIYGDSVRVNSHQYPEIHSIVMSQSQSLGLTDIPDVFIYNGNGIINAVAIRFLSSKYVILMSDLVDLMVLREKKNELAMIIGHELGHHAAGHTDLFRSILILPAKFIPFLGAAYSRSCELTADRIGFAVTNDATASKNALVAIALGSQGLANKTNIEEFVQQENQIPELMGFIHKIFSTHPRMTKRIIELNEFQKSNPLR